MAQAVQIDFDQPIALFPLPSCVLLPHGAAPLHLFEPRYRQMMADVLHGARLVALALFAGDDWRKNYEGRPPLRPVVCIGYVTRHERTPDGRYLILLHGVCRAVIDEELPAEGLPYRRALLDPLEANPDCTDQELAPTRTLLDQLLADPALHPLAGMAALQNCASSDLPTEALVDLAGLALQLDTETRYQLLAQADPRQRALWLAQYLAQTRYTLALARRHERGAIVDGLAVN